MNIVDIEKMVELIKATEDAEIRAVLLDGLKHQLTQTNKAQVFPMAQPWGTPTAIPCATKRVSI